MVDEARRIGGYEIEAKLGAGTVGTVYRAKQIAMDRDVALKVLNPKHAGDPAYVERFMAEARTAGSVNHPNVCQVYEVGQDKGVYFFSMELVDGPSLEELLRTKGRMSPDEAVNVAVQAAQALAAAHKRGLIHRDIKPANLLMASSGVIKLVDLGLAKDVTQPTQELGLAGTPYYMAPEVSQGLAVDIRSDIYSLGATLYHLLTGRTPYDGPTATAVMIKHSTEDLVPPDRIDRGIPRGLSVIVERMMAKNVNARHPDPDELLADLADYKGAEGASSRRVRVEPAVVESAPLVVGRAPVPRAVARERKPTTAHLRPVGRERAPQPQRNVMVPVGIGGVVLLLLVVLYLLFGSDELAPRIREAESGLARADKLIADGTAGSLAEAVEIARNVTRQLPGEARTRRYLLAANRVFTEAIAKRTSLEVKTLDALARDVTEGRRDLAEARTYATSVRKYFASPDIQDKYRISVDSYCERVFNRIDTVAAKAAPAVTAAGSQPEEAGGGLDEIIREQINEFVAQGLFADAMTCLEVALVDARPEARRSVEALEAEIAGKAKAAFEDMMRGVDTAVDAGQFDVARTKLDRGKRQFSFPPYSAEIEHELEAIQAVAATGRGEAAEKAALDAIQVAWDKAAALVNQGKADEIEASYKELERNYGRTKAFSERRETFETLIETARAASGSPPEPETAARPFEDTSADEPVVKAASAVEALAELGWEARGGTWTVDNKGVFHLSCKDQKRPVLIHKQKGAANFACQFDVRIVSGGGFRFQFRWISDAYYRYAADTGAGYAVFVGVDNIRLQVRTRNYYYYYDYRTSLDSDDYYTWHRRTLVGNRWNRIGVQAIGERLTVALNGTGLFSRKDGEYTVGEIRIEFLPGDIELRKIVTKIQ